MTWHRSGPGSRRIWELPIKLAVDAAITFFSFAAALMLRFDGVILPESLRFYLSRWPMIVGLYLAANVVFGIYPRYWRYAGLLDVVQLGKAVGAATGILFVVDLVAFPVRDFPLSVVLVGGGIAGSAMTASKLQAILRRRFRLKTTWAPTATPVLIAGAGITGQRLARELGQQPDLNYRPVGFVDDDAVLRDRRIHGIPVLGSLGDIPLLIAKHDVGVVAVALPLSAEAKVRQLVAASLDAGAKVQVVPGIPDMMSGLMDYAALREHTLIDRFGSYTGRHDSGRRKIGGKTADVDDFLPYCLPSLGQDEIQEVADTIRSGWVTTGPKTKRFEAEFGRYVGVQHAIAVNSCTAGLHVALMALGIGPGDEVITTTFTFCSTVNVIVHCGATPVLVDVNPDDLCIDPQEIRRKITPRTKAILPVHYAGLPSRMAEILAIAREHRLAVVEDAAHALGATYQGVPIGGLSHATAFSFYATKNITTGEGGMVTTNDPDLAQKMRVLSLHGISHDAWKRYTPEGSWYYEVLYPGFKYNMTDLQASLGIRQLTKLDAFLERRRAIAERYDAALASLAEVQLPPRRSDSRHVWHLYPIGLREGSLRIDRAQFVIQLAERRIGASVHFIPVHLHPWYREHFHFQPGDFPKAEAVYRGIVSLPLYPAMSDRDVEDVVAAVKDLVSQHRVDARAGAGPTRSPRAPSHPDP